VLKKDKVDETLTIIRTRVKKELVTSADTSQFYFSVSFDINVSLLPGFQKELANHDTKGIVIFYTFKRTYFLFHN
jgi:hypothetical protein